MTPRLCCQLASNSIYLSGHDLLPYDRAQAIRPINEVCPDELRRSGVYLMPGHLGRLIMDCVNMIILD